MKVQFKNLGTINKNMVFLSTKKTELTILFSYETPVSFLFKGERVTRVNEWSTTTGKLLNELEPDKSKRISGALFELALEKALSSL